MSTNASLGEFGVEEGVRSRAAIAAAGCAVVALSLSLLRPVAAIAGHGDSLRWTRQAAALGAVAAIGLGLAGLYAASTRGIGGRGIAKAAMLGGVVAGLWAFFYSAVVDGTLQPGQFATQYFNTDIMRKLPGDFARGLLNTVKLALVAETLAVVLGLVVATFVLSPKPWFHYPAVSYVDVVRGLPLVVLTFLINFGLPNIGITLASFVSAVTILTINASAYVAEIFRAGIQSLPRGQMDAARSLGMPHGTAMLTVVVPQAARAVIPPLVSEFIALIKDVAIVIALIGFTPASRDLFGAASQAAASSFSPTPYMLVALVYLAMTIPLARLVGRLERRMRLRVA